MAINAGHKRSADEMNGHDEPASINGHDCNDPRHECRSGSAVFQPDSLSLVDLSSSVNDTLRNTLTPSGDRNMVTNGGFEGMGKSDKPAASEQIVCAISWDAMAAKLPAVDSILSIGGAVRKSVDRGSCAWVVQRFMKAFDGQTSPYAAKVTLFTNDEIREIIAWLFARYYRAGNINADDEKAWDGEDLRSSNSTERRTIFDIFCAISADQPDFDTNEAIRKYLSGAKSETDATIVGEITGWACEVLSNAFDGRVDCMINSSTPEELLHRLQLVTCVFTGEEAEGLLSPWPLVKTVDFGLEHPLLEEGIVLVDAPEIFDGNIIRASNALGHHKACTHKLTVAQIARAKGANSLSNKIASSQLHRATSGKDNHTRTEGAPTSRNVRERQLREGTSKKHCSGDVEDRRAQIKRVRALGFDLMHIKVHDESALVAREQQDRDLTRATEPLAAPAVGNESHQKHQAETATGNRPRLIASEAGVAGSGSRHNAMNAIERLDMALTLANAQISGLIKSLEVCCAETHPARKSEIPQLIEASVAPLLVTIRGNKEKMAAAVERLVLSPLAEGEVKWTQDARALCRKWAATMHTSTLYIFSKHGSGKGVAERNVPNICWNQELLDTCKPHIEGCFKALHNEIWTVLEEIVRCIITSLVKARKSAGDHPQFNRTAVQLFLDSFRLEQPVITDKVNKAMKKFRLGIAEICENTTVSKTDAYLVKAMRPIYESTIIIKGRGAPAERFEHFQAQVCRVGGVWSTVQDGIRKDFNDKSSALITDIDDIINDSFKTITNKFDAMCDQTDAAQLRQKLGKALVQMKQIQDGALRQAADARKAHGNSTLAV